ncbi:WXG100 family type VII secretion target [Streptomyces rubellomurinus]|uniref:WXG100 family type VII secretion target n=1 Tax=Streptomyces rubellomurinus (strain ATCC 31215) TaxID=359131 RepID=UPI0006980FAF|nr:hypothetical protein [Streptomyces rubellomurinus]
MPSVYAYEQPDGRDKVDHPHHERSFATPVTLHQVRSCDPEAFHRASEEWDKVGTAISAARSTVVDVLSALQEGWSGDAADLGRRALKELLDEMSIAEQEMEAAQLTLSTAATGLALARRWVAEADDLAHANSLTINEDGDIGYPAWTSGNDPDGDTESRRLAGIAGDIRNLLKAATAYAATVSSTAGHELDRINNAVDYRKLDDWTKRVVSEDLAGARDMAKAIGGEGGVLLPPDPYDRGSGDYATESPTDADRRLKATLGAGIAGMPFAAGGTHASENMAHYLSGTGEPLKLNVEDMLKEIPDFQESVATTLDGNIPGWEAEALAEYRRTGKPVALVQQTGWQPMSATPESSKDWFYAVGSFHYNTEAKVEVKPPASPGAPPEVTVTYKTHVRDRYNWDNGKSTDVPGVGQVTDRDIQRLHKTGLAREFDMGGASDARTEKL